MKGAVMPPKKSGKKESDKSTVQVRVSASTANKLTVIQAYLKGKEGQRNRLVKPVLSGSA